jgi:uncharacterized protein YndB with AHSA1/START domain
VRRETIVTAVVDIDAPPQDVFAFFIEPEKIARWLADLVEVDPRPGGRVALDIRGTPVRGEYVEIDPGRRLVLSWGHAGSDRLPPGSSRVEVTFTAQGAGTRVTLAHLDLPESERDSHRRGWGVLLPLLAVAPADPSVATGSSVRGSSETLGGLSHG